MEINQKFSEQIGDSTVIRFLSNLDLYSNPFLTGQIFSLKSNQRSQNSSNNAVFYLSFIVKENLKENNYATDQLHKPKKCQECLSYT